MLKYEYGLLRQWLCDLVKMCVRDQSVSDDWKNVVTEYKNYMGIREDVQQDSDQKGIRNNNDQNLRSAMCLSAKESVQFLILSRSLKRCQGLSLLLPHLLYHAKLLTNKLAGSCIHSHRIGALAYSFLGFDYSPTICQRPGYHSGGGWPFPIVPSLLSWNDWSILVTSFLKPRAALPFYFWKRYRIRGRFFGKKTSTAVGYKPLAVLCSLPTITKTSTGRGWEGNC